MMLVMLMIVFSGVDSVVYTVIIGNKDNNDEDEDDENYNKNNITE